MRKLWLRVERLCDKGAWRTTAAGRSFTPAGLQSHDFKKLFDNPSLKELLELCPDSGEYMRCFSSVSPVRELQNAFPAEHPLQVSTLACLLNDAFSVFGKVRCLDIVRTRRRCLYRALDHIIDIRGAEQPPNLLELFREIT